MSEEGILKQPENCEGIMKDYKKSKYVVNENKKKQSKRMNFIGIFFVLLLLAATGCSKKGGDPLTELKPEKTDHKSAKEKETEKEGKEETAGQEKEAAGSKTKLQEGENLAKVFVYVCGAVNAPGVYGLSQDSRVYQAIAMAGGLSADAAGEALNQASLVKDGERVYVPSQSDLEKGIAVEALPENTEAQGSKNDKININTCTKEELMTLPGIGSAKADSIISHRETSGPFSTTEELMQIEGIKEGVYNKIKDRITS